MSICKGTQQIAGISIKTKYNAHNLLDFKWSDHEIDDMSWLRADTFSWQDGTVYTEAYNKIALSIQGATTKTEQGVTFYECANGLRVALADKENNILSAYNIDGVAWYYILDTANQRFKLPRTKHGFVGLRDEVSKYVPESLPNITGSGTVMHYGGKTNDGAIEISAQTNNLNMSGGGSWGGSTLSFNAHDSSSTYQDNAPVQQKSTQMYLYFYVGEYSQTAIEQTAGLNAELFNGKVDINGNNATFPHIIDTYQQGTEGYNIWSNGYCEQWGYISPASAAATTISFVKKYKDTTYHVTKNFEMSTSSAAYYPYVDCYNKTVNGFTTYKHATYASTWKASGYLAEGEY